MADALTISPRHRITDANGYPTAEELRWRQIVYTRIGGAVAPTINELVVSDDEDSGLEEMRHEFTKAIDGLGTLPQWSDAEVRKDIDALELRTQVASLQSLLTELRREVEDLKQGQML
jgi:hypothetical protein